MKVFNTLISSMPLLLLAACGGESEVSSTENTATEQQVQTTATPTSTLVSGIDFTTFDRTTRPQDDIYQYVNGAWMENTPIPSDRTSTGEFVRLRDESEKTIRGIINQLSEGGEYAEGSDEQKVADFYRSFMDTETLNGLGISPIQSQLNEIDALGDKNSLATYFAQSRANGGSTPLNFYIDIDSKDATRYTPAIYQGGLGLPDRDYYFNEAERFVELRAGYIEHIEKMFDLAGLENGADAAQIIFAFESRLAEFHWIREDNRDSEKTYNKISVSDLPKGRDNFNWQSYLSTLGIDSTDIIINQPSFIEGFVAVVDETPLQSWQLYLKWQVLDRFAGVLGEELDQQNFEFFSRKLSGQQEQRPRWQRGVAMINRHLGEVVGKIYVQQNFDEQAKSRMQELVENLRSAYAISIEDLEWMSDDTKVAAKEKLGKFNPKIGYPDQWQDYSQLSVKAQDLVGNVILSAQVSFQKDKDKLGGPIQKWEWGMTPQTVNAYYNPSLNEIVFPAAILQPPFFNKDADDAVNYGGIGAVIGHEMGHGFDDQGAKFDGDGNLRNWWTESDLSAFQERTSTLVQQYAEYQVFDDLSVNGQLTLGENIGDLSGVTIAYRAYKLALNGEEAPIIDGLTGDQRFFIGWAQVWRYKGTEEALRNRVATDPHSPAQFRTIGALSNVPEFYSAFDITPEDGMYIPPEKRVKIW